ncbi:MAG: asparagine synthase (glutamine-hydrolyzing) [Pseudodesulfovibrio sp.]
MCGITGILHLRDSGCQADILQNMTRALAHRGPDGSGTWIDGPCGLGHTRLAILDLSDAGAQPMQACDGRYVISYNGEVYNFKELRAELEAEGHSFRSTSDTEVVLIAYAAWGPACVERFNGMFALAIWDTHEQSLFLARDRYGIKPLYYCSNSTRFAFASEHKAFLQMPGFDRAMDHEALLEYFTFQNIFTDKTFFKSVKLFPAGCRGVIRVGGELKIEQYWDYDFREPDNPLSENEYREELDYLFAQAVRRQMVSDVEVSAYLSGGIDSGAITAFAAQDTPYIKSFTCGFDLRSASGLELAFDEREKAEHLSYLFKTEHYEMVLKSGDMERALPKIAWHMEEPRVGQSYPNYYAASLASRFCKVVLAGTGGDELFGGYPWRYYRAVKNGSFDAYLDKYYLFWQRLIPNKSIKSVFKPIWNDVQHVWTRDIFGNVFSDTQRKLDSPTDFINHSLYLEAKTFLHGLLIVEDKLSMAHGLETRLPFLDNDLVDFAMRLPVKMKLGKLDKVVRIDENEPAKLKKYYQKTKDGKLILRKAFNKYVPDDISGAVKQGFSGPDGTWFKGESINYVRKMLFSSNPRIFEYLDRDSVHELVNEHLDGKANHRLFIWSLLLTEEWLKAYTR